MKSVKSSTVISSTEGFLRASAAAAMKDAAENTIETAVAAFEKTIRQEVYAEVSRLSIQYVESLYENADPLNLKHIRIVIDDRRQERG